MDLLTILGVALGLGLVIFVHELGHFAVAKWAGVKVERFSIGFGPVIAGFRRGETEYVLSLVPIGGYVKMLGEHPEERAEQKELDPRSFMAATVARRMGIISAGVIMNVLFAFVVFAVGYNLGVEYQPAEVSYVVPGSPAWKVGLAGGDDITSVNSFEDPRFRDLQRSVMFADADGPGVHLVGKHRDGEPFDLYVKPELGELKPNIGVLPPLSTTLSAGTPVVAGLPAAAATPPFQPADRVVAVEAEGEPPQQIKTYAQLQAAFSRWRDRKVTVRVERVGRSEPVSIEVEPNHFRTPRLRMQMGKIVAIQDESPAANALEVGDQIIEVNGNEVDPMRLPDVLFRQAGQQVTLRVKREQGQPDPLKVVVVPSQRPSWSEQPLMPNTPMVAPALGIAYEVLPVVLEVAPGSPAEKNENWPKNPDAYPVRLTSVQLVLPADVEDSGPGISSPLELSEDEQNWPYAFWLMQAYPRAEVKLVLSGREEAVTLPLEKDPTWFMPARGLVTEPLTRKHRTANLLAAARLGVYDTWDIITQVYLVLRGLLTGRISPKALAGPITIAVGAGSAAQRGFPELLVFLGLLSANLAVINFLPIPILDGGHMVFLIWEAIRGRPANERVMIAANYIGLFFIVSLMALVIYLDISRLTGN